jgi:hypothetical protein
MRRCLLHSGALGLVALAIGGCGGGDGGDTTAAPVAPTVETPAALSKEELIAQGDAICAEVNAAVGTVTTTGADGQASQVADLYSGMVERLKDLGSPSDDASGYDEFIAAAEGLAQAESDVELAAERGEEDALLTAESEASSALSSFQSAATSFGFDQCGEGPSAPVAGAGSSEEPVEGVEEEVAPEAEEEVAPETGGAGSAKEGGAGGGATAGGGTEGGGEAGGGEGSGGGIGPG